HDAAGGVGVAGLHRRPPTAATVTVAARLRQPTTAEDQSRAFDEAFFNSSSKTKVTTGGITHGGKAALEHSAHDGARAGGKIQWRPLRDVTEVGASGGDVHVAIDQARHQHAAAEIDRPVHISRAAVAGRTDGSY